MRILLDTHVWLWLLSAPDRFTAAGRARFASGANTFFLSSASVWEVVVKHALGKLRLPEDPRVYLRGRLTDTPAVPLAIAHDHALQVARLPSHHRDPFDRILIAQAQVENLRLMTTDRIFAAYDVVTIGL